MSEGLLSIRNLNVQFSAYGRSQQVLHDVSLPPIRRSLWSAKAARARP